MFVEYLIFRSPSILLVDDIDTLCPRRDKSNNEVEKRLVSSLLTLIDDLVSKPVTVSNIFL